LAWAIAIFVGYIYKETLLFLILKPTLNYANKETIYFIFTDVTEVFSVYFKIIMFLGNHVILFFTLYHFTLFLYLGLSKKEYQTLNFILKLTGIIFLISTIFFYKILLPISWQFFLSFQSFSLLQSIDLYFESKLNEYLNFYMTTYFICLFYCQVFVLLILFLNYLKANLEKIKYYRKVLYCSFIVVSTLITPPDVISQLVLSFSMIIVYEFLLWVLICQTSLTNLKNKPIST
jgi:sec-independent protein translocase protein TatC